jgi:hypothetical protein
VIWIRGGFDRTPQPVDASLPVWPVRDDQFAQFQLEESTVVTRATAIQLMMLGKSGPFSLPGIVEPPVVPVNSAGVQENAEVIGVAVNGRARAYCLSEMQTPFTHVVNDVIDRVPVTVTYCNRTSCARVLTSPDEEMDSHLDVGVGGFVDGQMLLHVGNRNFSQNSADIPLKELDFERTTWGAWKSAYPDTDVCTGLHEFVSGQGRTFAPAVRDSGGDDGHAGE